MDEGKANSGQTTGGIANLKPFPKGVSGNPLGRPPGARSRSTIVKELLEMAHESGKQNVDVATAAVLLKALGGDVTAWEKLMDSAYGKLTDKQQVDMIASVTKVERTVVDSKDDNATNTNT